MSEQQNSEATVRSQPRSLVLPVIVAVVSVIAFLDASIFLRNWAMTSAMSHTIDHVFIFLSGSAFGGAVLSIVKSHRK